MNCKNKLKYYLKYIAKTIMIIPCEFYYNLKIKNKFKNLKVISFDETLKLITENKLSVSRYGDGEFNLILGKSINFNIVGDEISCRLEELLKSECEGIQIGIPDIFSDISQYRLEARYYWIIFLIKNHKNLISKLNFRASYCDSLMTRPYMDYKERDENIMKEKFKKIKKIWEKKEVFLIEGETSRLGVNNDLFDNTLDLKRLLCPNKNAFQKYNEIINEVKKVSKDKIVLIALGPTATILAYDLCLLGYQAIDIGHVDIEYEWFLKKENKKVSIVGKNVNEAIEEIKIEKNTCMQYKRQVIKIIKS